jgi:hypothetical protein
MAGDMVSENAEIKRRLGVPTIEASSETAFHRLPNVAQAADDGEVFPGPVSTISSCDLPKTPDSSAAKYWKRRIPRELPRARR